MRVNLKIAAILAGKRQREIAAATGVAESRLSSIFCGAVDPSPRERSLIKKVLHVGDDAFASAERRSIR